MYHANCFLLEMIRISGTAVSVIVRNYVSFFVISCVVYFPETLISGSLDTKQNMFEINRLIEVNFWRLFAIKSILISNSPRLCFIVQVWLLLLSRASYLHGYMYTTFSGSIVFDL